MSDIEQFEILVLGSGEAGKYLAWTMAKAGHRTAMVERRWLGGSCPNIACLPSKNLIYSATVASLARRGAEFGLETNSLAVSMKQVQRRKRTMVQGLHQMHEARTVASEWN
jgi:pyruvate/2-oxoglutarate dehydrogenase complex dihydrolipoamide dehydrogenase (E3) component